MRTIQEFQAVTRDLGFTTEKTCDGGTVLWLTRKPADNSLRSPERICIDSLTNSVTVYLPSKGGRMAARTFRSPSSLQEWLSGEKLPQGY
jgi:hypothetical protein